MARPRGPVPVAASATGRQLSRQSERPANLMFERRVFRGAPFKLLKKPEISEASSSILLRERLLKAQRASPQLSQGPPTLQRQSQQPQQPQQHTLCSVNPQSPHCPPTVSPTGDTGKEIGLQTDPHVVVLTAAAKETEAAAQTDKVWDRPVSPFVALKAELVDADTQIQDGELFNFDEEVVPVLEVLIGRVIEQSLSEVLEEEELRAIRQQREAFERERLEQLIAVQALEAAEERRQQEANRRVAEEAAQKKLRVFAAEKQAAMACAGDIVKGLEDATLQEMLDTKEFIHPVLSAVELSVWPQIKQDAVLNATQQAETNVQVLAGIAAAALRPVAALSKALSAVRQRRAALHIKKKLKQVEVFNNLQAQRRQEAEERRLMEEADDLQETRAEERRIRDREQLENQLLEAEDVNVLLVAETGDDPDDPQAESEQPETEEAE